MFKRLNENTGDLVSIRINGKTIEVPAGETVAAAILVSSDLHITRTTTISNSPRAPFCLMGVCFECLMIINGQPNQRSCKVLVKQGMNIESQHSPGSLPT
ncbi:MAG: (2Fe-2S)-binding protein [Gammaproteobacteria bacterium]|jgi:predicted molibdopterin-dependent oxidoreductase YjgC|nr:(2Fe-2S)-binding protein [Gammaproteobacteria bacterium]MBT3723773.1 (2Fe-2S)-binding protein [Gammaproteobacteria bacterium]MBT4075772.1 (2Fe-2S)-binding protein [Gammaproteobacteria bacterium]MBT4196433.1 (2Fe-2S)-binding protein [Gammaproteobacteria bacterium]MBT4448146.1 (2Fe-2S)-binding protein [Gammaproteobacteria bacterium]